MKLVIYTDRRGYKHGSILRDSDDDNHPEIGIPKDPPPIENLIKECAQELHNALVDQHLFTWDDVQRSQNGLTTTILAVFRRKLIEAYRSQYRESKE